MSDLDLKRYDGHTPGPWNVGGPYPSVSVCVETWPGSTHPDNFSTPEWEPICILDERREGSPDPHTLADARLIADAPLLLAEVRRLREENKTFRAAQKSCEDCDAPTAAQVAALRQSHARLLVAIKNDCLTRVTKEGLCWCHMQISPHGGYCAELRAAVAEAEGL